MFAVTGCPAVLTVVAALTHPGPHVGHQVPAVGPAV